MSELEDAYRWYETQRQRLKALDQLVRDGRTLALPALANLLSDFVSLPQKDRLAKLQRERDELNRLALVRLFAAFEADARTGFAQRLLKARAAQNGNKTGSEDDVLTALGESIQFVLRLHRALDPADLSSSSYGRLSDLRGLRNLLVHEGFRDRSVDDPTTVYRDLKAVLAPLLRATEAATNGD